MAALDDCENVNVVCTYVLIYVSMTVCIYSSYVRMSSSDLYYGRPSIAEGAFPQSLLLNEVGVGEVQKYTHFLYQRGRT